MAPKALQSQGSFEGLHQMPNLQLTFKLFTEAKLDGPGPLPVALHPLTKEPVKENKHRLTKILGHGEKRQPVAAPMLVQVTFLFKGAVEDGDPVTFAHNVLNDRKVGEGMIDALFPEELGRGCTLTAICTIDKNGIIQDAPSNVHAWVNLPPKRRSSRRSSTKSVIGDGYDYGQKGPLVRTFSVASSTVPTKKPLPKKPLLNLGRTPKPTWKQGRESARQVTFTYKTWGRAERFKECHLTKGDQYYEGRNNGTYFAGYTCRAGFELTARDRETGTILAVSDEGLRSLKIGAITHMVHQSCLDGMKIKVKSATVSNNTVRSIDLTQQKWEPCRAVVPYTGK